MTELIEYLQMLSGMAVAYVPKLLLAVVALIVGLRLVNGYQILCVRQWKTTM